MQNYVFMFMEPPFFAMFRDF